MATTKIWAVKNRLGHVLQYAEDAEKTENAGASSQPEAAADREKPAKPELKKPAFLEEKKPEPYKKTTLSFLKGVNTAQEPSAPAEKAAEEAPSAESEPPAVAVPTEKSELPVNPTSHVSWNTDELPIIEDVLGIEEAAEADKAMGTLFKNLFIEPNPIPGKAAMALLGLMENSLRLPLVPALAQTETIMTQTLKDLHLL